MHINKLAMYGVFAIVLALIVIAPIEARSWSGVDWLLYNGKIVTVDSDFTVHEAIAIQGEQIVWMGANADAERFAGDATRRVNLQRRTVLPGLIDNHNHLLTSAMATLGVDLSGAKDMDELKSLIADAAQLTPKDRLIVTSRAWHEAQLSEGRLPTRRDLDEAAPEHAVYVLRGGHTAILNSKAISIAGVSIDTPVPEGGKVGHDPATGELTGEFIDNAIQLIGHLLPPPPEPEVLMRLLEQKAKEMLASGYTSIRDPGLEKHHMLIYQELRRNDALQLRVSMMPRFEPFFAHSDSTAEDVLGEADAWGVRSGFGGPALKIDAVKLIIDGGFEGGLMREPYMSGSGMPNDYHGIQVTPTDKLASMTSGLNQTGWRVATHVVGDRGMDILLDAYETANLMRPLKGQRWVIEHAFLVASEHIPRIKALGLVVTMQHHAYAAASSMLELWGRARTATVAPVGELLDAGIIVGGGTDWPVVPYNPFAALGYWVTRKIPGYPDIHSENRALDRQEALRMYTANNAYITFEEDIKGSLEPGKYADLIIIDRDYLKVPDDEISSIEVIGTMVAGKWAYLREEIQAP